MWRTEDNFPSATRVPEIRFRSSGLVAIPTQPSHQPCVILLLTVTIIYRYFPLNFVLDF